MFFNDSLKQQENTEHKQLTVTSNASIQPAILLRLGGGPESGRKPTRKTLMFQLLFLRWNLPEARGMTIFISVASCLTSPMISPSGWALSMLSALTDFPPTRLACRLESLCGYAAMTHGKSITGSATRFSIAWQSWAQRLCNSNVRTAPASS